MAEKKSHWCEVLNFCVFGPLAFYLWDRRNIALKVEEARYTEAVQKQSETSVKIASELADTVKSKVNEGSGGAGKAIKQEAEYLPLILPFTLLTRNKMAHMIGSREAINTIKDQVKTTTPRSIFNRIHFMVPVYMGLGLYWLSHKIGCPIDKYFQNPLPINPAPEETEPKEAKPQKEKVVVVVSDKPDELKKELGLSTHTDKSME